MTNGVSLQTEFFFFVSFEAACCEKCEKRQVHLRAGVYVLLELFYHYRKKTKQRGTNASYRSSGNVCNLFVNLFGNSSDFFEHLWFFFPLLSARSNELFVLVKRPICWLATSDQLKKEFSSI